MAKTLTDKLEAARLLIYNSKDKVIAPLLDTMGIDNDYLKTGETLYTETMELMNTQKKEYQEQSQAYDKFYVEKDEAEASYKRTLKLVRALSRNNDDLQNRLGLQSAKAYAVATWIEGSLDFYNRLLNEAEFLARLKKFKVTEEKLKAEQKAIENLKDLRNNATAEKGQAQEATRVRNAKLDELDDYCMELRAVDELALADKPQLLEKLGIVVKS